MKRFSILLLVALICVAMSAPSQAQAQQWMDDPGQLGPYPIGHTSYMLADTARSNRPVFLDVWYPADIKAINSSTPPAQYALDPFSTNLPITTSKDWELLGYDPAYEGPPASNHGLFPLLILSPGFDDDSWQEIFIGTRLASHGYVVAVLDHYADCQWGWSPCDDMMTIAVNRPRDASFAITQLLAKDKTPGELLFRTIDAARIAMSGHSYGGYATYALAGGDNLVCDSLVLVLLGNEALPYPSSTCVPTYPDRRIKAMITLDGSSWMMLYRELARISIPSLILGETVEHYVELHTIAGAPDPTQFMTYDARPHGAIDRLDSYRVDINGANHYSFTNYCDSAQVFLNLGLISSDYETAWLSSWPCTNTGLDPVTISSADEHQVVTKYMIAFLNIYLARPNLDWPLDLWILTPQYALDHTPQVQFFNSEKCKADLPDDTYFTYRPHQTGNECDVAQKDPTGWFTN